MNTTSRHEEFAFRLDAALSDHPKAPPGHGRNTWLKQELCSLGVSVSLETIRKWLAGEALPRPGKMSLIAQALRVDASWLELGVQRHRKSNAKVEEMREALEAILELADDERIQSIARDALVRSGE